jgi:uncharacterized protein
MVDKLMRCLNEVPHAVGVNTHMGSSFSEDWRAMENILRHIKHRPLIFVDSFTSENSVAFRVARNWMLEAQEETFFSIINLT